MVDIMLHAHQYVPTRTVTKSPTDNNSAPVTEMQMHKILFGGDQLTVARARGAKKSRKNSTTSDKRLEGLVPCIEDWHAKVILIEVIKL